MQTSLQYKKRIFDDLNHLPEDKLAEVEDFVSFLKARYWKEKKNIISLEGLWSSVDLGEDEIKEARKKAWESLLNKEI